MRRLWLAVFLLIAVPAHAQTAWGLPQLMQSLAQIRSASAQFSERETSPILSAPLISTGTLTYIAPAYLRKETTAPAPQNFTLDHGQVTLTTGGATHVFALNQDPRIAGLVEGISGTLSGDLPGLQRIYTLTLTGSPAAWQLQLLPKAPSLARFIRAIVITGAKNRIASIDTTSADGSDSRMSIDAP
jgi:hypothetical protein